MSISICNVFAIDLGEQIILFDCGNGESLDQIDANLRAWDLDPGAIAYCFITHPHFDHSGGASLLQKRGVKLVAHTICAEAIGRGDERVCSYLYHKPYHPCETDLFLRDEDRLKIGDLSIEAIYMPGHAEGSMVYSFSWRERMVSVTGDLVAESGSLGWSGSIDFNPKAYIRSLKRFVQMKPDIILPGHRRPAFSRGYIWAEQALNRRDYDMG